MEEQKNMTPKGNLKIICKKCSQHLDVTDLTPFSVIACPVCHADIVVPMRFSSYLLDRLEGIGGTSKVYRGTDLALDRQIAVKIMLPEALDKLGTVDRFLQEARTAATLTHPAVIPIYTCGICDEKPYIVMQYMSGGTLEVLLKLKEGKLEISKVLQWMIQIAGGLESAAKAGIVHHDVKPANIMLDEDGNAKIGDFGIAQFLRKKNHNESDMDSWLSPEYVSPEKVTTQNEDCRGDIYSFGVSFYELLTGELPFSGKDTETLMKARLNEKPTLPIEKNPQIPQEISDLIMKTMCIKPEDRPSYAEIINTLNTVLRKEIAMKAIRKLSRRKNTIRSLIYAAIGILLFMAGTFYGQMSEAAKYGNTGSLRKQVRRKADAMRRLRIQSILSSLFSDFLLNNPNAIQNAREAMEAIPDFDHQKNSFHTSVLRIMQYLSKEDPNPETFFVKNSPEDRETAAMTAFAVMLRQLYSGKPDRAAALQALIRFSETAEGTWLVKWLPRVPEWRSALSGDKINSKRLEPLFITGEKK